MYTGPYTPTVTMWTDSNGVDVGTLAIQLYSGLSVLLIIAAIAIGMFLAFRLP